MKIFFKEWCYKKVYPTQHIPVNFKLNLDLLIRCMWAINRGERWTIGMDDQMFTVLDTGLQKDVIEFFIDNSEQEALTKALVDIYIKTTRRSK